jgi:starch-binding outer membrane protein, SusD/RagB family
MTHMKFNHTIFALLLIAILFSSCKKFLDQTSPNEVEDQNMFKDKNSLLSARIGLYNTLQSQYYYGGYFPLMVDAYSDNGTAGGYSSPALDEFTYKSLTPDNIFLDEYWIAAYNTIYTANEILSHIDVIQDPTLDDSTRNDVKGEAYCIRAMAHFDLLRMFGEHWDVTSPLGIPLVLKVAQPTDIFPRNSVQDCYNSILSDLNNALALVSNDNVEDATGEFKTAGYVTNYFVQGLLSRVYLYEKDYNDASQYSSDVINSGQFALLDASDFTKIYTSKLSSESIFELLFNIQDRSQYNSLTYVRSDALRSDVYFLANAELDTFFMNRPGDLRAQLLDFDPDDNDPSIQPDGRTQKYRGEETQDNSGYIMRISELYLIRAESEGATGDFSDCQNDLNSIRENRGLSDLTDVGDGNFENYVQDERRAELNFEGNRYFDLARIGQTSIIGAYILPDFPIPQREVTASKGEIVQYPGY